MAKSNMHPLRNLNMREMIGCEIEIIDHTDPGIVGIRGIIIDETRNMFLVDTEDLKKNVSKKGSRFRIKALHGGEWVWLIIDGDSIIYRPEDRTKRCEKKPLKIPKRQERSETEDQP